jgi:2-dehydro-3-deoxy-D-arabinonate dehydratase
MNTENLPPATALVRVQDGGGVRVAVWTGKTLRVVPISLDELLTKPLAEIRDIVSNPGAELDPVSCDLLAPVESQEVWAAGVTYERSREARMEESAEADIYAKVYEADRPELFFKAPGWRVVPPGSQVGVRPDSTWNVPEPELAILSNSRGEVVAYSIGNDMSSRSIEGENPLYLPQAKVYDRSCSLGPAAVLAWAIDPSAARIAMRIERGQEVVFDGTASVAQLVRDPAELVGVLHSAYQLPVGAWLLTGTSLVPPAPYTATQGDTITIAIDRLGSLVNDVVRVRHTGATARPRLHA